MGYRILEDLGMAIRRTNSVRRSSLSSATVVRGALPCIQMKHCK